MAETRKKAEGEYLMYQGKPLVREGNTLVYGDLNHDPYMLVLDIMSYKDEDGKHVPDKIMVQLLDAKDPNNVINQTVKNGMQDAFSLGLTWLDAEIKQAAKTQA